MSWAVKVDEASVMLAPLVRGGCTGPPAWPVRRSLRKESTSSEPFVPGTAPGLCVDSFFGCSRSSNVLPNGFGGTRPEPGSSGCDTCGGKTSPAWENGSAPPSSSSSLELLSVVSLSAGGYVLGSSSDSGDGGGDCTRTFFTTFGFWKLVFGGGSLDCPRDWRELRKSSLDGSAGRVGSSEDEEDVGTGSKASANASEASGLGRFEIGVEVVDAPACFRRNGLLVFRDDGWAIAFVFYCPWLVKFADRSWARGRLV